MSNPEALVVFTPSGRRGRFPLGTPVLQAARSLGVDIDSVCGGRGICGRCQVLVSEGEFAKHGLVSRSQNLSPFGAIETAFCETQAMQAGRRLSCSAQLLGDVVIDVPSSSQVHKQVVRKQAEAHDVHLDPLVRLHYVEVQQPVSRQGQTSTHVEYEVRPNLSIETDAGPGIRPGLGVNWKKDY